jgi:CRISPR-associated protein Cas1
MTYLADLKTLYLLNPEMEVWATGTQVRWRRPDGKTEAHPREGVRDLVVHCDAVIKSSLWKFSRDNGCPIALVDGRFGILGRFTPPPEGKGGLRSAQYELCRDTNRALTTAKAAIAAKCRGQRDLLVEYGSRVFATPDFVKVDDAEVLLGVEGAVARAYFDAWPALLEGTDFGFSARRRHPAPDPVNALYDTAISLLANDIFTLCVIVGLDPYLGFYHKIATGRPSLVADLIEEWRAPVVDKFVLRCLRRSEFNSQDFAMKDGACRLAGGAWGKMLNKWTDWHLKTVRTENTYRPLSYRDLIELQVRHFARVCLGDDPSYEAHEPV